MVTSIFIPGSPAARRDFTVIYPGFKILYTEATFVTMMVWILFEIVIQTLLSVRKNLTFDIRKMIIFNILNKIIFSCRFYKR